MDKTAKRTIVKKDATSYDVPLSEKYSYVHNNDLFEVDTSEFELIIRFIGFIRGRRRGVFTAEIISHKGTRHVTIDSTDKDRFDLNPLEEE